MAEPGTTAASSHTPAPPRKLLLVINRLTPSGGAEAQLTHLARGLAANGHRVTLCCIDRSTVDRETLDRWGIELVALHASSRVARAAAVPKLARLARRADLVQCTMWDASLWGRMGAVLARRPVIVADHATDRSIQVATNGAPRADWIALHNRLLDPFTFATVACATTQPPVLIAEGVSSKKIVYIPNGVPVEEIRHQATRGPTRAELGLPPSSPVLMQVGVLRPEKNQLGALDLCRRVRETVPDAHLVFVGDGPMRSQVERRASELGASSWAHFLGQRPDAAAMLALADLALLPSASDAMPMVALESMAVGVPVVASDVGDVRRVLGDAGAYAGAGDTNALADQCVRLLGDDELRARMGRAGLARSGSYDYAAMVSRYEALIEAACSGASAAVADAS